jgi:glycerol-3-phosphate O-acyltransferase
LEEAKTYLSEIEAQKNPVTSRASLYFFKKVFSKVFDQVIVNVK